MHIHPARMQCLLQTEGDQVSGRWQTEKPHLAVYMCHHQALEYRYLGPSCTLPQPEQPQMAAAAPASVWWPPSLPADAVPTSQEELPHPQGLAALAARVTQLQLSLLLSHLPRVARPRQ